LLQAEGFRCRGYVDIFDGGPTVECNLQEIRAVRDSRLLTVTVGAMAESGDKYIVANTQVADFRATALSLNLTAESNQVTLSPQLAQALRVQSGQQVRILPI
jgi:arginine N-succinyltransferase